MLSTETQAGRSLRRDAHIDPSFYGRSHEKARIEEAMAASLSGNVAFALVHGASGVGKSTLVQHYVQQLDGNELILRGRCYEQESVPYKAIDSAVDALCEHLLTLPRPELSDILPSDISLLAQLFPVLNRLGERVLFPAASTGASDARRIRRRSVQAMREILARLRRDRPVILTIDDLQWGDVDSISLLGEIFSTSDPPPVLVLCTYRREYRDRSPCLAALFELQKSNPAIRWFDIAVDPFSAEETHDFAQSLLGDTSISEASLPASRRSLAATRTSPSNWPDTPADSPPRKRGPSASTACASITCCMTASLLLKTTVVSCWKLWPCTASRWPRPTPIKPLDSRAATPLPSAH